MNYIGKAWNTSDETVTVSESCTLYARTIDNAGEVSDTFSIEVKIDRDKTGAPTITKSPSTQWSSGNVRVTISAGLSGESGICSTQYSFDNKRFCFAMEVAPSNKAACMT